MFCKSLILRLLLILLLACPSWAWGTTYYFSNAGNDSNAGTEALPYKTIGKLNTLSAGGTAALKAGDVWREQIIIPNDNITVTSYGYGNKPLIIGCFNATGGREAIRNASLEDYTSGGESNDTITHHFVSGDYAHVSIDVPSGSSSTRSIHLKRVSTARGNVILKAYLPASTSVTLTYDAKYVGADGYFNYIRYNDGSYHYLKSDNTWTATATYDQFRTKGGNNTWATGKSFTFTTDAFTGPYYIALATYNVNDRELLIANPSIHFDWSSYEGGTGTKYKLATGYSATRFIKFSSGEWIPLTPGADKDTLADGEWIYEAPYIYYRSDSGAPSTQTIAISLDDTASESGIVVNGKSGTSLSNLAVVGWPGSSAVTGLTNCSGICSTRSTDLSITNCDIYGNYRRGIENNSDVSGLSITHSTVAYNGANGIAASGTTPAGIYAYITAKYNGYKGLSDDDGEGIGLGRGTSGITINHCTLHHNNDNGKSNQLVVWASDNNTVSNNVIYSGVATGLSVDGNGNLIHNNIVYGNCTRVTANCSAARFENNSYDGATGGNFVINNVFSGGGTSYGVVYFYGGTPDNIGWKNNTFKNNIIVKGTGGPTRLFYADGNCDFTGTTIDYNIIYPAASGFIYWIGNSYATMAAFTSGQSQNSHGLSSDPLFTSSTDFHLQSASPAINAGVNVCTGEGVPYSTCTGSGTGYWFDRDGHKVPDAYNRIPIGSSVPGIGQHLMDLRPGRTILQ